MIWGDSILTESTPTGTQDSAILTDKFADDDFKGWTLARMIVDLTVLPAALGVDSIDVSQMFMGIAMVSQEAAAGGIFPDPHANSNDPLTGWLWKGHVAVAENAAVGPVRVFADIGTQRKLMYGNPYLIMNNVYAIGSAFTMLTRGIVRSLYYKD